MSVLGFAVESGVPCEQLPTCVSGQLVTSLVQSLTAQNTVDANAISKVMLYHLAVENTAEACQRVQLQQQGNLVTSTCQTCLH